MQHRQGRLLRIPVGIESFLIVGRYGALSRTFMRKQTLDIRVRVRKPQKHHSFPKGTTNQANMYMLPKTTASLTLRPQSQLVVYVFSVPPKAFFIHIKTFALEVKGCKKLCFFLTLMASKPGTTRHGYLFLSRFPFVAI